MHAENHKISRADIMESVPHFDEPTPGGPDSLKDARPPVLIIGAGSSGLVLAHGLQKHGIKAIVLEREACIDPPDRRVWSFIMAWSAPTLQTLIPNHLWASIDTALADPSMPPGAADTTPLFNSATGEQIGTVPLPQCHRFFRPRFRKLLAQGIDIRFGKNLRNTVYGDRTVTAHFDDGSSVTGSLLVAADGLRSLVRRQLLGPEIAEPDRLPYCAIFINAKYTREQALYLRSVWHPVSNLNLHPDGLVTPFVILDAPDPARPEEWTYMAYVSWKLKDGESVEAYQAMGKRELLRFVKKLSGSYAGPARSAFDWLADDHQDVYFSQMSHWDPRPAERAWDNHGGLVTLMGDAAHPMTHQRAQGLNHAIDDAGNLAKLLSKPEGRSQKELIDAYEAEMRPRAGQEVEICALNTKMLHDWSWIMKSPAVQQGVTKSTVGQTAVVEPPHNVETLSRL